LVLPADVEPVKAQAEIAATELSDFLNWLVTATIQMSGISNKVCPLTTYDGVGTDFFCVSLPTVFESALVCADRKDLGQSECVLERPYRQGRSADRYADLC
jgi:hypothetical protein